MSDENRDDMTTVIEILGRIDCPPTSARIRVRPYAAIESFRPGMELQFRCGDRVRVGTAKVAFVEAHVAVLGFSSNLNALIPTIAEGDEIVEWVMPCRKCTCRLCSSKAIDESGEALCRRALDEAFEAGRRSAGAKPDLHRSEADVYFEHVNRDRGCHICNPPKSADSSGDPIALLQAVVHAADACMTAGHVDEEEEEALGETWCKARDEAYAFLKSGQFTRPDPGSK